MFCPSVRRVVAALAIVPALALLASPTPSSAAFIDLPPIDRIVHYQPKLPLQVFTADGVELAQFGAERRDYVPLARTPKLLQDAVLAIEDTRFREHGGVDAKGMARAALALITGGRKQGASTITQQLVRTMLLTRELTVERKAKEIWLAFKVEEALSKDRILEIYLNEIFLGQRAYGFAAAAQTYFGKPMDKLSIAETAMLAGLPQNPYYANPVANFERATQRQRVVLERMRTVGVINDAQLVAARAEVLNIRPPGQRSVDAAHVAEMARRAVVDRFGESAYSNGLRVYTSLRAADQRAAHAAVQRGVLAQDRRQPWRGPEAHEDLPGGEGPDVERAAADALKDIRDDDLLRSAIVLSASAKEVRAQLASGESVRVGGEGLKWAQPGLSPKAKDALKIRRGSVLRLVQTGKTWAVSQWPDTEAALVACARPGRRFRLHPPALQPRHPGLAPARLHHQAAAVFGGAGRACDARHPGGRPALHGSQRLDPGQRRWQQRGRSHHPARGAGAVEQPGERARAPAHRHPARTRLAGPLRAGRGQAARQPHAGAGHRAGDAAADGPRLRRAGQRRLAGGPGGGGKNHRRAGQDPVRGAARAGADRRQPRPPGAQRLRDGQPAQRRHPHRHRRPRAGHAQASGPVRPVAALPEAPAGLARSGDDWLYSEWANGGAVASLSDGGGTAYAGPPTLIDAIRDLFK